MLFYACNARFSQYSTYSEEISHPLSQWAWGKWRRGKQEPSASFLTTRVYDRVKRERGSEREIGKGCKNQDITKKLSTKVISLFGCPLEKNVNSIIVSGNSQCLVVLLSENNFRGCSLSSSQSRRLGRIRTISSDREIRSEIEKIGVRFFPVFASTTTVDDVEQSKCDADGQRRWRRRILIGIRWHDVTWHDVTWRDLTWRDLTWRDVTWRDVAIIVEPTLVKLLIFKSDWNIVNCNSVFLH